MFFAILIISEYNRFANRRLYWAQMDDVRNLLVVNSMRRATFDQIMRCLHFTDNMNIDEDRFYKVRPIIEHLNKTMERNKADEFISVEEIMVPYYGRHRDYLLRSLIHLEPECTSCVCVNDIQKNESRGSSIRFLNKFCNFLVDIIW